MLLINRQSFIVLGIVGLIGTMATPSYAQVEGFRACAGILSDSERLACYDAAVAKLGAAEAAAIEQRRVTAKAEAERAAAQAKEAAAKAQVAAFGAEGVPGKGAVKSDNLDKLSGAVAEVFTSGLGYIVVVMDNGQIWRQTEAATLPPIRSGDPVTIKKGLLGNYRLTFDKQGRTIRVKRFR